MPASTSRSPELHYHQSQHNQAILEACPSLFAPYNPTPWAANAHAQIMLYMAMKSRAPIVEWELDERLEVPDGGTVSLQWCGLQDLRIEPATPVLLVLPTITGSGDGLRGFVQRMQRELGWLVVVCNRRGHAELPLTAPSINTMGNTHDLRHQISAVQKRRPQAPLFAVGLSAGSGLLVRYIGEEGANTPLSGSVVFCPAYDIRTAFHRIQRFYDSYMTKRLKEFFLQQHKEVLQHQPGYERCSQARTMAEFHERLYSLAGFATPDEYFEASNPMPVSHHNRTPTLVINAQDDPICAQESLEEGLETLGRQPEHYIVAVTRRGSHCAFYEGNLRPRSWAERVMVEYFQAVHRLG